MTSNRKITLLAVLASLSLSILPMHPLSADESYPSKSVKLTVGFGPGGPSGISARFLQKYFEKVTGKDLIIINKPGGGGAGAWSEMNQLPADGYNLTLMSLPQIILQPGVTPTVGYEFSELNTVLVYTSVPQVFAVPANSEFDTVAEFLTAAKAQPGSLTVAGTASGGSNHSAHTLFNQAADIKTVYIPFKDTASTVAAVKGGQTKAAWTWATQGIRDQGSIKILGLAADERMELFPDLPTIKEQGVDMKDQAWWGIGVPSATPEPLRKKVSETFLSVMQAEGIADEMIAAGYVPFIVEYDHVSKFKEGLFETYSAVIPALKAN